MGPDRSANGVSRRHGRVARRMWRTLYEVNNDDDVPITHVTNGVHVGTWLGRPMRRLLDRYRGERWPAERDPSFWTQGLQRIPDEELWAVRNEQRAKLVEFVRERTAADRLGRGERREYVREAADPSIPTCSRWGSARRPATYKRLHLLVHDPERALRILAGPPSVQLLIAGKAHPSDDEAKGLVRSLFALKEGPAVSRRVAFLHEYDLGVAGELVAGCDRG